MGEKSRDILLEEKIDQIDDSNFGKVYDINEIANNSIDQFDSEIIFDDIDTLKDLHSQSNEIFSMEVEPNEFLDNLRIGEKESKCIQKPKIKNRPLIFTFTSILALLGILFIYNMFVINSLEYRAGQAVATAGVIAGLNQENNVITFENGSSMEIENVNFTNKGIDSQTNWFDSLISGVNQMFGGNY